MKKTETHADREENLRQEYLEKFETHILDDYLNAISFSSGMPPEEILAVLHHITFDYIYDNLTVFESGGFYFTQNKKYRGSTPVEIAFSF